MTTDETGSAPRLDRRRFVGALLDRVPEALVISGLGSPSYDVYANGERPENFYLWGAMGAAVPLGLGLALARPERSVLVLTGDGEHLMGIGALGTVGALLPPNLTVAVLDNGHYGETGMQPGHTSMGTDLVAVAKGFGIPRSFRVTEIADVDTVADRVNARGATTYVQALVEPDEPPRTLPPRDGVALKNRFRATLALPTF